MTRKCPKKTIHCERNQQADGKVIVFHGACKTLFLESKRFDGEIRRTTILCVCVYVCMRLVAFSKYMLLHRFKWSIFRLSRVNACEYGNYTTWCAERSKLRRRKNGNDCFGDVERVCVCVRVWVSAHVCMLLVFRFHTRFPIVFVLPLKLIYANSHRTQTAILNNKLRRPASPFLWRKI